MEISTQFVRSVVEAETKILKSDFSRLASDNLTKIDDMQKRIDFQDETIRGLVAHIKEIEWRIDEHRSLIDSIREIFQK